MATIARKLLEQPGASDKWPACHVVGPDEVSPVPFHLAQQWAWDAPQREIALSAGYQSGKTCMLPWWLEREIKLRGRGDYYAVSATYDLFKLKMVPALLQVFEHILGVGRYWAGDRLIEIADPKTDTFLASRATDPMWARIILRSADAAGGLESGTGKGAIADESSMWPLMAYRALCRRLSVHQGRLCHATTLYNHGWFKREVLGAVQGGQVTLERLPNGAEVERTVTDDTCVIHFDSIVNPSYPMEEWERAKASMPSDEFDMFLRGRATSLRTLIYDCFTDLHIVPSFRPREDWPRAVGIDPVGAHTGVLWLAYDPDKEQLHAFREYLEPFGATTVGHAQAVLESSRQDRVVVWVCGQPAERQARADWQGAGIPVSEPPISDVWVGINRVYTLLKQYGLVIHDCCENLIDQLGSYQRKRNREGDLTDQIEDKETYHLLDALRYVVAWLTEPQEMQELVYQPIRIGPRL